MGSKNDNGCNCEDDEAPDNTFTCDNERQRDRTGENSPFMHPSNRDKGFFSRHEIGEQFSKMNYLQYNISKMNDDIADQKKS